MSLRECKMMPAYISSRLWDCKCDLCYQPLIRSAIYVLATSSLQGCTNHQCSEYTLKATQAAFAPIGCTNPRTYSFYLRRALVRSRPSPLTWTANSHTPHLPRALILIQNTRTISPPEPRHKAKQSQVTPTETPTKQGTVQSRVRYPQPDGRLP